MLDLLTHLVIAVLLLNLFLGLIIYQLIKTPRYLQLFKLERFSNLGQRVILGSLFIKFFFLLIFLSHTPLFIPLFILTIAALIGGALWEYYQLVEAKGSILPLSYALIASSFYVLATAVGSLGGNLGPFMLTQAMSLYIIGALFFLYFFYQQKEAIYRLATTLFGIFYITVPLSSIISINYIHLATTHIDGRAWLLYLLIVTKMTDIGAYFTGKWIGKWKMAPTLSPNKTFEGLIGGLSLATLCSVLLPLAAQKILPGKLPLEWPIALFLGIALSLLAVIGDLAESLLKRDAAKKDSNHLPGFGGLLDTVDSLIFTTPFLYFFLQMRYLQ